MPYKLRKAPKRDLYWVVTIETGKKHSKDPIPLSKAKAQMRILEQSLVGGTIPRNVAQQFINILEEVPPRANLGRDLRALYNGLSVEDQHKVDLMVQNMSGNEFEYFGALLFAGIHPEDIERIKNWFYEDAETDEEDTHKSKRPKVRGGITTGQYYHLRTQFPKATLEGDSKEARKARYDRVVEFRRLLNEHQIEILKLAKGEPDFRGYNLLQILDFIIEDFRRYSVGDQTSLRSGPSIKVYTTYMDQISKLLKLPINPERFKALPIEPLPKPEKVRKEHVVRRAAGKPSNDIIQQIAKQSYKIDNPQQKIEDWDLVSFSPTLKFYKKGNEVVVGIRGTKDSRDASADLTIAYNGLADTDRFKDDLKVLEQFQKQYPDVEYYGAAHSLGGAILDQFLEMGLIKSGVSYNPAIQPKNFTNKNIDNHRIFQEGDPLYALAYPFLKVTPEVRKKPKTLLGKVTSLIGGPSIPSKYLAEHALDNFKGGMIPELETILKTYNDIPVAKAKKAYLMQQVVEGSDKLAEKEGFVGESVEEDGYTITAKKSPKYSKAILISYHKGEGIGHDIVLIKKPFPKTYEYYNSTGAEFRTLPAAIRNFVSKFGLLEIVHRHPHQGPAPICSRIAIYRAMFDTLNNDQFDKMVAEKAATVGVGIDDYIWQETKKKLVIGSSKDKMNGGALNDTQVGLSFIPAVLSSAVTTRSTAVKLYNHILTGKFEPLRTQLNEWVARVTFNHYKSFQDIATIGEMKDILSEIKRAGVEVIPPPLRDDPLGLRGKYGYGKHGGAYAKGKASVFVLTCIDPRYNYDVTHFLEKQKKLHKDYDLFVLAGASVGAEKKEWTKTFFDNLELGMKLHGIKEVWCFDHMDCGMYKATFNLKKDDDPKLHIQCMDKLKKLIAKKHPSLGFKEFLVSAAGKVEFVGSGKKDVAELKRYRAHSDKLAHLYTGYKKIGQIKTPSQLTRILQKRGFPEANEIDTKARHYEIANKRNNKITPIIEETEEDLAGSGMFEGQWTTILTLLDTATDGNNKNPINKAKADLKKLPKGDWEAKSKVVFPLLEKLIPGMKTYIRYTNKNNLKGNIITPLKELIASKRASRPAEYAEAVRRQRDYNTQNPMNPPSQSRRPVEIVSEPKDCASCVAAECLNCVVKGATGTGKKKKMRGGIKGVVNEEWVGQYIKSIKASVKANIAFLDQINKEYVTERIRESIEANKDVIDKINDDAQREQMKADIRASIIEAYVRALHAANLAFSMGK